MIKNGKIICACGKELDYVFVDGYVLGRLMEGILFKVSLRNSLWVCIGVKEEVNEYMKQFNWEYWSSMCEQYCNRNDLAKCPLCGEEEV